MRRLYSTSLMVLFVGVLVAGSGMGLKSTITFRVGAVLVVLGFIGVLVYAFRPKGRERSP